jgi:hypothetical protein
MVHPGGSGREQRDPENSSAGAKDANGSLSTEAEMKQLLNREPEEE